MLLWLRDSWFWIGFPELQLPKCKRRHAQGLGVKKGQVGGLIHLSFFISQKVVHGTTSQWLLNAAAVSPKLCDVVACHVGGFGLVLPLCLLPHNMYMPSYTEA